MDGEIIGSARDTQGIGKTAVSAKLSLGTKLLYGVGSLAFGIKDQGFSTLLLIFYNQVVGLPAALVGIVIFLALMVDSILDPYIGQLSDRWRSKWGRRHPFMYAAALPAGVSFVMLWHPPEASQSIVLIYLFVVAVIVRTFITFYEIPSAALAPELSTDYDERTRLFSFRQFFGWIGGIGMTVLALQVFLRPSIAQPVGQLNREGYADYALVAASLIFASIIVSALGTHRFIPKLRQASAPEASGPGWVRQAFSALAYRPFSALAMAALFNAMAQGLVLSMQLYLSTYLLRLTSQQIGLVAASSLLSAFLGLWLAAPTSRAIGKMRAARVSKGVALVFAVGPIILALVGWIPTDGSGTITVPILFVTNTVATVATIICAILINSMISDVVEDYELYSGRRSEGVFFAVNAFVAKVVSGLGVLLASAILAIVGFPEQAAPGTVAVRTIAHMGELYVAAVAVLYLGAMIAVSFYRITRADHEAHLKALAT